MKKQQGNMVKFCPRCNSIDVSINNSNPLIGDMGISSSYICHNCGYVGTIFPETKTSEAKKLKVISLSEIKDLDFENVDIRYGKFLVKGWFKIVPIIFFAFAILFILISLSPKICERKLVPDEEHYNIFMNMSKWETVCIPDKNKTIDPGSFILGIILFAFAILTAYLGFFRKIKK